MRCKIAALTLCFTLILSLVPVIPVYAAGISPVQGEVGSDVTISGLTPGETYVILWDDVAYKTGAVPLSGAVTFPVGDSEGGSHSVKVKYGTVVAYSTTFTVVPSIIINASSGTVGTPVDITGTGFSSAENKIVVTFDEKSVKSGITANSSGTWTATFSIPDAANGNHAVDAYGNSTEAADVADKTFSVSSKITVTPNNGGVGTNVTVTGTGFESAENGIFVTYDDEKVRTGLIANVNGTWNTTFTVPSSTRGSHTIDAEGDTTLAEDVEDKTFTVSPRVTVEPTSGYVGDEMAISGSGFANDESGIRVTYDGKVVKSSLEANGQGYWSTTVVVPASTNGAHVVNAYGNTTVSDDVLDGNFTVEPLLTLNPKIGNVEDVISVIGSGFSKKEDVSVTFGDEPLTLGVITDNNGNFSTGFEVPPGINGDIIVSATDAKDVTASSTFSIETTPPEVPRIASPKDGGRVGYIGDTKVRFDWTDVTDPSGVRYTIQVSEQSNFTEMLVNIDNLSESMYTLTEAESLPPGSYYWRVKATDRAGNESAWTQPALVKTAVMTVKTAVIVVVAVIAFFIVISVVPRLIRKLVRAAKGEDDL